MTRGGGEEYRKEGCPNQEGHCLSMDVIFSLRPYFFYELWDRGGSTTEVMFRYVLCLPGT